MSSGSDIDIENEVHIWFSWYDYLLFSLMLGLSALIGVYFAFCTKKKQVTADEYLLGGKEMTVFPIALSLTASAISGTTLLAVPTDIYRYGTTYGFLCISVLFASAAAYKIYIPVFHKLQLISTYEYLELRFNKYLRLLSSFLFTLSVLLILPLVIYAPALAFAQATGINVYVISSLVSVVCIFYTTIGGLKAVVWTDALQFVLMVGAVVVVLILGVNSVGGIGEVFSRAYEGDRFSYDYDLDPTKRDTVWAIIIGSQLASIGHVAIGQSCVQKFLALPTMKDVRKALCWFIFGADLMIAFSVLTGIIIYAKYAYCDPVTNGKIQRHDQILPLYIMEIAENVPGLSGLYISGIVSAGLSTLSAYLNCLAGTVYEDFISPFMSDKISQKAVSRILKALVVVIGIIGTISIPLFDKLKSSILPIQFSLMGITLGPLVGLFSLGMMVPMANAKGAITGGLSSLIIMSVIVIKSQIYQFQNLITYPAKTISIEGCENVSNATLPTIMQSISPEFEPSFLFRITYWYYGIMGCLIVFIVGIPMSYLTKSKTDKIVNRDLITPIMQWALKDESLKQDKLYYSVDKALKIVCKDGKSYACDEKEKQILED